MEERANATWKTIELDENDNPTIMHLCDNKTGEKLEETEILYHANTDTPVERRRTHYTNNRKNQYQVHFDREGKQFYSFKIEQVSESHTRRYTNEVLFFEVKKTEQGPSYTYFYPNEKVLIHYTTNGDGSGVWQLYDEAGQSILSMEEPNESNPANFFSFKRPRYEDPKEPAWERAIAIFKDLHHENEVITKLSNLEIPKKLAAELKKVDWDRIDSRYAEGYYLPYAINGTLCDDEELATESFLFIWREILHKETYDCTFKVINMLARMLPLYENNEAVTHRLLLFLNKALNEPAIKKDKTSYKKLIKIIAAAAPVIETAAKSDHKDIAEAAQFLLAQVTA